MDSSLKKAADVLRQSSNILVITGAGISAESGIPTFRGEGGYWRSLDPMKLATPQAFAEDPKTVWEWYDYRRSLIAGAQPNAAHLALAALEEEGKRVFIISQNVDDLHERAGSREVVHIHGSIWEVRCLAERRTYEHREAPLAEIPPRCHCGGLLRPNVVWFGEALPTDVLAKIEDYYCHQEPDILFVIGTEGVFPYISGFVQRAKELGALAIEINPSATAITRIVDCALHQRATEALDTLIKAAHELE
jgi:NAD-dependent protein deacetylase/lipoamidase